MPSNPLASVSKMGGALAPLFPYAFHFAVEPKIPICGLSANGEPAMSIRHDEDPHRKAFRNARDRFGPVERADDPFRHLLERLEAAEAAGAATGGQNSYVNDNRK